MYLPVSLIINKHLTAPPLLELGHMGNQALPSWEASVETEIMLWTRSEGPVTLMSLITPSTPDQFCMSFLSIHGPQSPMIQSKSLRM